MREDSTSFKMIKPISRVELLALPEKHRKECIANAVQPIYDIVRNAATMGELYYFHIINEPYKRTSTTGEVTPYIPTPEDIAEGLQFAFPDCKVEVASDWVNIRPGVCQYRKGIRIDWS
jgi:hypothetical protein